MAVKRRLEAVGRSTAQILLTTQREAEELRQSADEECAKMPADAEATARRTREAAQDHARETRAKADADARSTTEAALADLDRMCEELAAVIADHRAPGAADAHDDRSEANKRVKRGWVAQRRCCSGSPTGVPRRPTREAWPNGPDAAFATRDRRPP